MKRKLIVLAVLLQFAMLFFMCGKREFIACTGHKVYLRTAPVDPRDIFRGDYVQLRYEINQVPAAFQKINNYKDLREGSDLYAVLKQDEGGLAELDYLADEEPDGGLYLKGKCGHSEVKPGESIHVTYGIEKYFVQQHKGLEMEKKMWGSRSWRVNGESYPQTPLEVKLRMRGGTGVITGHRWSVLGHDLRRVRPFVYTLTLQNVSERTVALVLMPGYDCFTVEPQNDNSDMGWRVLRSLPDKRNPQSKDVTVLKPGQKKEITFDFSANPLYYKNGKREKAAITEILDERFRIVYRPPSKAECKGLPGEDTIWHGYLPSSAFSIRGSID